MEVELLLVKINEVPLRGGVGAGLGRGRVRVLAQQGWRLLGREVGLVEESAQLGVELGTRPLITVVLEASEVLGELLLGLGP